MRRWLRGVLLGVALPCCESTGAPPSTPPAPAVDRAAGAGGSSAGGPPARAGAPAASGAGGETSAPSCEDAIASGSESDVDCGGPTCVGCGLGRRCRHGLDCLSAFCSGLSGRCASAACDDGEQNGGESDVDCGGTCVLRCGQGKRCLGDGDCGSGVCAAGSCAPAGCSDGQQNGTELGVDCGGPCPACVKPGAHCKDLQKNGDETGYDCGGSCPRPCPPFEGCQQDHDCLGDDCDELAGICRPSCTDGLLDGDESGPDCGGSCPACRPGLDCFGPQDCTTGDCQPTAGHGTHCQPLGSCSDGVRGGAETDVDCGGPDCLPCAATRQCLEPLDCASGHCQGLVCQ